jgi:hypothetical protein
MPSNSLENVNILNAFRPVVGAAVSEIDHNYGTGYPDYNDGLYGGLAFHNGYHTRGVIVDFDTLASVEDLDPLERAIGIAAASAHDIIKGYGEGIDEVASVRWLERAFDRHLSLDESQVSMGGLAILGTQPVFESGMLVDQLADSMDYPTARHELVARILASADLGRLYTPDGPYLSHMLLKELNDCAPLDPIDFEKVLGFQRQGIELLERYTFPLASAIGTLAIHKPEVIAYCESLIDQLEKGKIDSWRQLMESDLAFMHQFS